MLTVTFGQVTLAKAGKYLMLLMTNNETKRTNVSQWASKPIFNELQIDQSVENVVLKLCETTSDKKLKIVGIATVNLEKAIQKHVLFQGEVKLQQQIQGQRVCLGICYVTIRKSIQFEQLQLKKPPKTGGNVEISQLQQQNDDEQLADQQPQEPNEQIRIEFHCGFGFYLGSQFRVQADWGKETYKTQYIKDKINPVWTQSACLSGLKEKKLEIKVCDHKNNILQNVKIDINSLRVMFPYHLRIRFKNEFMGAIPQVFISIVRQTYPLFSIAEIPVRFCVRSLVQIAKPLNYLIVSLNNDLRFPRFIELNLAKLASLELINKHINSKSVGQQDRIDLVSLPTPQTTKSFSVLKAYLNRKLYLHFFTISDIKAIFSKQDSSSLKLVQFKAEFQLILRRIYYNSQTFTLKKYLEIYNPQGELTEVDLQSPAQQRWKVLSNNYLLRNNIVLSTKQHIQNLKKAIEDKGQQIVQLKKVVIAVKNINNTLSAKEKLMNSIKNKKIRYNVKQITNEELITALIARQSELQQKKTINLELALRMDCLSDVQQNHEDLSDQLIQNSKELLEQQEKVQRMKFMQKELGRQREMIAELQKMFQSREIDKRVNQVLREQSQKLRSIKEKKQQNLLKVYNTVKQQGKQGGSMAARIKRAQQILINLNEQYARMVAL